MGFVKKIKKREKKKIFVNVLKSVQVGWLGKKLARNKLM